MTEKELEKEIHKIIKENFKNYFAKIKIEYSYI